MSSSPPPDNPLLRQSPTIHPYRHAAALVGSRLRWDLNWRSWVSRARLRSWRDRYAGQKAVVVCNGPSLLKTDLTQLQGVFTFGLNKINLLFDKTEWRPSCVVAINGFVLEQNRDFFNQTSLPLFLHCRSAAYIRLRPNVAFLHSAEQHKLARDCSVSINEGYTVTVAALQLAFHMGFTQVALVGCDHNFAQKGPANATVTAGASDPSHFDPNYFAGGVKWQLPDLENSEHYYGMARQLFELHNRSIVNATDGGNLEVFPRFTIENWLSG
jgi:hypothetical protein